MLITLIKFRVDIILMLHMNMLFGFESGDNNYVHVILYIYICMCFLIYWCYTWARLGNSSSPGFACTWARLGNSSDPGFGCTWARLEQFGRSRIYPQWARFDNSGSPIVDTIR